MSEPSLKLILEALLMAAGRAVPLDEMLELFDNLTRPDRMQLREALDELRRDYAGRAIELAETGGGFRIQVREGFSQQVSRLWEEKPPRYSRALLETLAIIAYRQPITRGEIEEIRGVAVSSNIIKTLSDREWIRVVGHRDVPGRPALLATSRRFLDHFNLQGLDALPTLAEIRELESINRELELEYPEQPDPSRAANTAQCDLGLEEVVLGFDA
ncbi:MAG: SMC-Scp complex subunit ScpB [Gammaproteobacteria bacterium]|nr:SMC-Scp complex subunit ScpB [Gammaproteobacteria bacterium]MBU1655727.1 SMC-Scp complex subunit ScpB [Gammaproteobacteria bacterium]MBU1960099.1 SMC-Scp complex subunit ScpB [Gammaproteobacteria bacterium]